MNIGIIGMGLIGGSLARAVIKNTEHTVYARDISTEVMLRANLLDAYHNELTDADYSKLDMLIVALYPKQTIECLSTVVPLLKDNCVVMDICGNKTRVVQCMQNLKQSYPCLHFIGTHPMAGREFSGIKHSSATLFEKASILLVPIGTPIEVLNGVKQFYVSLGFSGVIITTASEHDSMIAYTSQLAHIVSSSYIKNDKAHVHYGFSAGSFRDMTRVARLNAEMWSDLMLENRENLLAELEIFITKINEYEQALKTDDRQKLSQLLDEGNDIKLDVENSRQKKLLDKYEQVDI